jgi:hypothetical protein
VFRDLPELLSTAATDPSCAGDSAVSSGGRDTRLDLGPSRGLTLSFAGRPGACPMRGASLRALAPGQAVSR